MDVDLDLLADLLEAYEEFDHHDAPDFPRAPGVLVDDGDAAIASEQLRPADRVVKERVDASGSDDPPSEEERRQRELQTVYHHVGLLVNAECLITQEEFYGALPALESPDGHDVHALTMKGHQLLDRLRDDSGGDGEIGFATS